MNQEEFIAFATAQLEAEAQAENAALAAAEPAEATAAGGEADAAASDSVVAEAEASAQSVETAQAAETTETAAPSPEQIFAELSGGKDALTKKAIVKARLANFDQADANDDDTLDDFEKAEFADLVWGRAAS